MLPPGHIAAGYLTAKAYIALAHPALTAAQDRDLLWLGALFGFIPDLDMFAAFIKLGSFTIQSETADHRKFATHIPWVWMAVGLIVAASGKLTDYPFVTSVGMIVWLATWSHFILDSLYWGVRWLWPFSQKCYAFFRLRTGAVENPNRNFFSYWSIFIENYFIEQPATAYLELVLIVAALTALFAK